MSARRLVLFDVDGTLVDSQAQILRSMQAAFDHLGRPMPPKAQALAVVGLSLTEAIARLAPDLPAESRAALVDQYRRGYFRQRDSAPPPLFPGAQAALDMLAARDDVVLGVATGKSRRGLDHLAECYGWADYFVTTQTADEHPSKPNPSMIAAALRETGAAPEDAVIVGDTEFDIEMGRRAGIRTVAVGWGYHPEARLRRAGAECWIGDFPALLPALDRLWGLSG